MINILIVDDRYEKVQSINKVLEPILSDEINIITAQDINGAKRELRKRNFDIMILDIYLPQTFGKEILPDGGMKLLKEIKESRALMYSYPKYVISVSGYKDSAESFKSSEGIIHTSIFYDPTNTEWEKELLDRVRIALTIVSGTSVRRAYDYDIAVVCALKEEMEFIAEGLQDVKEIKVEYDDDIYYTGFFEKDNQKIRVVFSNANQMGMIASTALTTKMITHFTPKYIVMTGITGGTKTDKMNYGDVIVASCSWDYRAGKDVAKGKEKYHLNSIDQKSVDSTLISHCRRLKDDTEVLRNIKDTFKQGIKPETELKLLIGPVVSGASVITDPDIVQDVLDNQDRTVLGIEMEIYGMYYAANWALNPKPKYIAMKAVSDFANESKGDMYHKYASYTSAKVFEVLAKEYFTYDD